MAWVKAAPHAGVSQHAGPDRPPDASWGDEGERLPETYGELGRGASVR